MSDTIPSPTERPILFSGPMVRAILEGHKTQTRRIIKPQPYHKDAPESCLEDAVANLMWKGQNDWPCEHNCPCGVPGDRLWVRETFRQWDTDMCGCGENCICPPSGTPCYRATVNPKAEASIDECYTPWCPSIYMPRWASRITLEITGIRVERLRDISENDAKAEGVTISGGWNADGTNYGVNYTGPFSHLWNAINCKRPGYAWADNPWVWVIEFKRIEP